MPEERFRVGLRRAPESPLQPYAQSQLMYRMEQLAEWNEIEAPPFVADDVDWYAAYK